MRIRACLARTLAFIAFTICAAVLRAQVNVTTYHNDNARSGQYTQETVLTPSNVNSTQFGKLFTTSLDGWVYAQPLYLSNVAIGGDTRNILYVATDHDSLYAIDADTGTIYWRVNLIPNGGTTVNSSTDLGCDDLIPEVGITGTPVIDTMTGTIYLVTKSKVGSTYFQHLHAIDVSTAAEKFGGPISIQATVAGTAPDGNGKSVSFNARDENQRAALLLDNGHVLVGWSSHCDHNTWHGWVMSYGASSLVQEGVYNTSPNGAFNGIWMSGGGLAADDNGNIYFATGNGTWNGTTDLGESIIKLGPPSGGAFPLLDYFTPYNQGDLTTNDEDMASGGVLLLPTLANGRQLLTLMAKEGKIFLIDRNNLGKYCPNQTPACTGRDPQIVQEIPNAAAGLWGSPAYWNGSVYWGASNDGDIADTLKAFSFNAGGSGLLSTTPTSRSARTFGYSAPVPAVSANGATNGILWGLDNSAYVSSCAGSTNCQILYAYDATNLGTMLYNSSQAPQARDVPGSAVKFTTPIIANGKVYVGSRLAVSAYGLLGSTPPAATSPPEFSPAPGNYTTTQSVQLSDSTPGALIYYTLDGSAPLTTSPLYSAPLQISTTTTLRAMALAPGFAGSAVTSGTYVIGSASSGAVSIALGSSANVDGVGIDGSPGAGAGLDGNGFTYSATLLGSSASWSGVSFTFGAPDTLNAASGTTIPLPAGSYSKLYMLATGVDGNQLNQSFLVTYTDGTTATFTQSLSDWSIPQHYAGESVAFSEAYRLSAQGVPDSHRVYSLYGYTFTLNSGKAVQSLTLPSNRNVIVLAVTLQTSASVPVTATPVLTPAPGSYTVTQSVQLSDSTPGAVIHYTLDGSAPLTTSPVYSTPLQISATTTVRAMALAPGFSASTVAGGTYSISGGSSGGAVSVSLGSAANVDAIGIDGFPSPGTGVDNSGFTYSATLLGSSASWSGVSFTFGAPQAFDAASGTTIPLPAGGFSKLYMLATGVDGNQLNQSFLVTYTDGTMVTFTQSLSDWSVPQHYAGESVAFSEAYRLSSQGVADSHRVYSLYGYTLTLNSGKSVQSLTLPRNRNVVVLAVTLQSSSSVPVTATPVLSPAPGSFPSAQSVQLSDSTPGAVIHYTLDGSAPLSTSPVYSTPLQISATTILRAMALAAGFSASTVAGGTYSIGSSSSAPVSVALGSVANVDAIGIDGLSNPGIGLDSSGFTYSATLLGSSASWSGVSFTFGAPQAFDAASGTTIPLPAGGFSKLYMLATGVDGNQLNQSFLVTYTDGTTATFTQSLSDWSIPQHYAGESVAFSEAYRLSSQGVADSHRMYSLYGYSFTLSSGKSVQSLTLPRNRNVIVLALTLAP